MKEFFEKISDFFKNILKKAMNASKMAKIITIASVVVIITTVTLLLVLIPANSVKSIALDKSTLELTYGGVSETLVATVEAKDKTVTWTSSNENVVRVEEGVVTPVNAGEATITVKSSVDEDKYAQCLVTVLKASNSITSFAMEGWTYGDAPNNPTASAVYGTPSFSYSTQKDGPYTSTKPTDAGSYYVLVVVEEGENYNSITKSLQFTISKANYDMKDAKWDYTNAFTYSGEAKKVEVQNLPSGVTVKEYTNNSKTDVGDYIATVTFDFDKTNYNEPTLENCSWSITKAAQSTPAAPEKASVTSETVTLTALTTTGQGDTYYGYSTENDATKVENWKTSVEFTGLTPDTTYYFFAKYEGNEYYEAVVSESAQIKTNKQKFAIKSTLTNVTANGDNVTEIEKDGEVTLKFAGATGCKVPGEVTVSGASYTWDQSTGELKLSNPTGEVSISMTGVIETFTVTIYYFKGGNEQIKVINGVQFGTILSINENSITVPNDAVYTTDAAYPVHLFSCWFIDSGEYTGEYTVTNNVEITAIYSLNN